MLAKCAASDPAEEGMSKKVETDTDNLQENTNVISNDLKTESSARETNIVQNSSSNNVSEAKESELTQQVSQSMTSQCH